MSLAAVLDMTCDEIQGKERKSNLGNVLVPWFGDAVPRMIVQRLVVSNHTSYKYIESGLCHVLGTHYWVVLRSDIELIAPAVSVDIFRSRSFFENCKGS